MLAERTHQFSKGRITGYAILALGQNLSLRLLILVSFFRYPLSSFPKDVRWMRWRVSKILMAWFKGWINLLGSHVGDLLVAVPARLLLSSRSATACPKLGPVLKDQGAHLQDSEVLLMQWISHQCICVARAKAYSWNLRSYPCQLSKAQICPWVHCCVWKLLQIEYICAAFDHQVSQALAVKPAKVYVYALSSSNVTPNCIVLTDTCSAYSSWAVEGSFFCMGALSATASTQFQWLYDTGMLPARPGKALSGAA